MLFVDHTPVAGGAELVLATHIAALDRDRFEPLLACTDTVPMLISLYRGAGAAVHVVPMPRLRRLSPAIPFRLVGAARALRLLVREQGVDLVVANTSRAAYIASVALVGLPIPLVWWVRDFLFGRVAFRLLAWRASRFLCVSAAVRDHYAGRDDPRFTVVRVASSFDEELPRVSEAEVRAERARWGFRDEDIVVGFMGRLVEEKGPEDVIRAVGIARAADPRLKLLVVGSGRGQHGDVEQALRDRAAADSLDYVVFAGFQRAEAVYYRLFDVFVLATRSSEPYATSVVQAMMAGTPVVATETGGTPELVHDGVTGLLVPPSSPEALADAILRLVNDAALRERLARAAQAEVMANNRESVVTDQVEALYEKVLGAAAR